VTTALRTLLARELLEMVEAHHLVVWQDDSRAFTDIAPQLVPERCRFDRFDGSWMALRHRVENDLAQTEPPRLVIYIDTPPPPFDPLEEVRTAAHAYDPSLGSVVRRGLRGQLPESRVNEIATESRTFAEAEIAAGAGAAQGSVVLASVLGAGGDTEQLLAVLSEERDGALDVHGAWPEVHSLFSRLLGISSAEVGAPFRSSVARTLLVDAVHQSGALPERLQATIVDAAPSQAALRRSIVGDWWLRHPAAALRAFATADDELRVGDGMQWVPALDAVSLATSIEGAALIAALAAIASGDSQRAADLATSRRRGRWVRESGQQPDGDGGWSVRWAAVSALAELQACLADPIPPMSATSGQILSWYIDRGWQVDRAHRRFELALTGLDVYDALDEPVASARSAYDTWLSNVIRRFTGAIDQRGFDVGETLRQGDVHGRFVAGVDGLVAYVWVDAMRFELAADVAESIRANGHTVELHAAIAALPTITPVGMANLCPGASASLTLDEVDGKLIVRVAGTQVKTVEDRRARLRGAHGQVADVELASWVTRSEKELASRVTGADLILIRSLDLDATGENGIEMLSAAWSTFSETQGALARMVAKLATLGVKRVVISADHGFIALSRRLDDSMRIDAPKGGKGELHRRGWVGRGATDHPSVLRLPVASAGIGGDLDVLVPRGLAVFAAGGSKQFFHGGLSPQELVVPVIVADLIAAKSNAKLSVDVDIVGGKITTGVFGASVTFSGDLFTSEVVVRVIARRGSDQEVAQIADGDGYDRERGTITVTAGSEARLLFKVTRPLEPNDHVELQVFDARTDQLLGKAPATVAAPVSTMEDDLD
jgi:hypothetical protein